MTAAAPVKIALVTGAGAGIGRSAALALARDGWTIVLAGRRLEPLEATAGEVRAGGATALCVAADVSREAEVDALFARARGRFGRVDLLFNNAGIGGPARSLEEVTPAEWREVIDINLTGAFLCTRAALRLMKTQSPPGGRIINNGSLAAHVPRPHSGAYTASKHGISGLTRATALEGRPYRIACGQVDIGNAATAMGSQLQQGGALQANGTRVVEPVMDVAQAGEAVRYMASLPLEANVLTLTVMATGMPYVGRG
jgi:NAD(P)-dependent dehydrogenase (short-subunit alcohol dehydrogenase family)